MASQSEPPLQYPRGDLVRPPGARPAAPGPDWSDWQCLPHSLHQCGEVHHCQISILQSKQGNIQKLLLGKLINS